ncbi:hypothetical protein [Cellulosimicrobium sp. Marseille-Q4280]|uniref:hypothetical protein n=1 Tax=Cellulosimicrobium sp. Marseille-Q4280 TaxID=2937992 RepID=UPI00204149C5|nr:hypothetical protein [Cellulosimicrobium sp. Marseille-Q4280]
MNHSRVPAGVTTGGQFATGARSESTATLTPPTGPDPRDGVVRIDAQWRAAGSGWDALPVWPEGAGPTPTVTWEHNNDVVQTTFSFNDGAQSVTYWKGSDGDTHNTYDDNYGSDGDVAPVRDGVFGGDSDTDTAYEMRDWMYEVHSRIDTEAYGVTVAATTEDVRAAVLASALGEPQPVVPADDGPVRMEHLEDDWADDPGLSEEQAAALMGLSREQKADALAEALSAHENEWFTLLDSVRGQATRNLLEKLGLD